RRWRPCVSRILNRVGTRPTGRIRASLACLSPWLRDLRSRPRNGRSHGLRASARGPCPRSIRNSLDRKSTRLNSSHVSTSYAVFCLKKKQQRQEDARENRHIDVLSAS